MTQAGRDDLPQRWDTGRVESAACGSPTTASSRACASSTPCCCGLNLLLLMAAAFLPFPTAVLAQSFDASERAERVAIAFYGATALVIELLLRALWGRR